MHRDLGLWDADLYELDDLYSVDFNLDKAGRLLYHETLMTHAMLFTGVDTVGDGVRRWRVENSWGEKSGVKGYFTMNDNWFAEYVFEIATRKEMLPASCRQRLISNRRAACVGSYGSIGALDLALSSGAARH